MHVVSVEIIPCVEPIAVYDISIESDESFLLANGVIAHNSTTCLARHGLRFDAVTHAPIGHSIPYLSGVPYHPLCRSTMLLGSRTGGRLAPTSASTWLKRQDTAYQDAVLGPTRGRMFREGTLSSLRDLVDGRTGRPLTVQQLQEE
jgi:hypothetical protein